MSQSGARRASGPDSSRVSLPATLPPRGTTSSSATTMLIEQRVEVDR